jgi:hypothetical protein
MAGSADDGYGCWISTERRRLSVASELVEGVEGIEFSKLLVMVSPARAPQVTSMSAEANSERTWRQAPQGGTGAEASGVATAMALNRRLPEETAVKTAERSAQLVRP